MRAAVVGKPKIKPRVPMRKLHWTMIPSKDVASTMWKDVDDGAVKLDIDEFESMFCTKAPKKKDEEKKEKEKPKKKKKEFVRLIEDKRSYAVDISLARLRMPYEMIRDSVMQMDEEVFPMEKLNSLIKIAPTPEEATTVKNYEGDVTKLASTERFFLALSSVPRISERLKLFAFKLQFTSLMESHTESIETVKDALNEIKKSGMLKEILKTVLAFGNYMNGSTRNGGAYGFKLATLNRLKQSKSVDNKKNLLSYLIIFMNKNRMKKEGITKLEEIEEKTQPGALLEDLSNVKSACRVEAQMLRGEVNKIGATLRRVEAELKKNTGAAEDRFAPVMSIFYKAAKSEFEEVNATLESVVKEYTELSANFGEKDTKCQWEVFFKIFADFVIDYTEHEKRLKAAALKIKKEKERQAHKEEQKKQAALRKEKKAKTGDAGEAGGDGSSKGDKDSSSSSGGSTGAGGAAAAAGSSSSSSGGTSSKIKRRAGKKNLTKELYQSLRKGEKGISEARKISERAGPRKAKVSTRAGGRGNIELKKGGTKTRRKRNVGVPSGPPCRVCGCNEFVKHKFRKGCCSRCMHEH